MKDINPFKINDSVYWTGILDEDLVTFDIVMETRYGTTYNSYFIRAEKNTIIDTVKENFSKVYLNKIESLLDPSQIEYIVCNHTEPDHSGCVKHLLKKSPDATVVGSGQALNYLREMIDVPFKSLKIKDGDTLDLVNKRLRFIHAPNLHWPDTIYTYLEDDQLLFTCDSFGAHYCNENMFDDQVSDYPDTFKYYFDVILKPYSKFMLKAIEKIKPLAINMICPGHGPILRSTWKEKVELSAKYANEYLSIIDSDINRVLIAYVSAYGYTGEMAELIAEGIRQAGNIDVEVVDIEHMQSNDLEEKIIRSHALLVGSPTINRNTLLPVYRLFSVINPLRDKEKLATAFGSYGWSGEAVKLINDHLKNLRLNVVNDGIALKFYPSEENKNQLVEFGKVFGEKVIKHSPVDS